mmetsp:Transcript_24755/g.56954  ORF Transcript_24755/g.56954 Transcript_24755/m.56954 type:complete len:349 (+) Transcript_24755:5170-6216(+)
MIRTCLQKRQHGPRLVQRHAQGHRCPHVRGLRQGVFQIPQLPPFGGRPRRVVPSVQTLGTRRPFHRESLERPAAEGQHVQLVVTDEAVSATSQAQEEPFVEARDHVSRSLRPIPGVDVHGHRVQLPQTAHAPKQEDDETPASHRLDRPRQQVRRQGLEVLEDADAVRVSQKTMRVAVIAPCYGRGRDEKLKRIGVRILRRQEAPGRVAFQLLHALPLVTAETQLLLVAPQHARASAYGTAAAQDGMEVHHLIFAVIADQDEEAARAVVHAAFDQGTDAFVQLLSDHDRFGRRRTDDSLKINCGGPRLFIIGLRASRSVFLTPCLLYAAIRIDSCVERTCTRWYFSKLC